MNDWISMISLGLSLVAAGVAIGTRNQIVTQLKATIDKMNGLPQDVEYVRGEVDKLREFRHQVNNDWSEVRELQLITKHLAEKIEIAQRIDEIRRKLG